MVVGPECSSFIFAPCLAFSFSQVLQQFAVVTRTAKLRLIQLSILVEFQKLIISLDPGFLCLSRQDPFYVSRNTRGFKVPQHTDPFISFLYIEITQIFIALDGICDTSISQVCLAQIHPFCTELCFYVQKRTKTCRKGSDSPCSLYTHNPFSRDFHQTSIHN